jgi:hypothetical protein
MKQVVLTAINIYPVKSLGHIALNEAGVEQRGLQYDRRWMLVDADNNFITQREHPRMALICVRLEREGLEASAPGMRPLLIPFDLKNPAPVTVRIWRSVCEALFVGEESDAWFSEFLDARCRLVYMPDESRREVNPLYAVNDNIVGFADGYPFHLIGEASLEDLNRRLEHPVPVNRFRPNFVVSGSNAYDEDLWKKIRIGGTLFHVVKPCGRCSIPTINQETGRSTGPEPIKTLARFRSVNKDVLFGQYLIAGSGTGRVRVGDEVKITERRI